MTFKVGDQVQYGVRYSNHAGRKGGIARIKGVITEIKSGNFRGEIVVQDANGCVQTFRPMSRGWVVNSEYRDDPKGRLYLRLSEAQE